MVKREKGEVEIQWIQVKKRRVFREMCRERCMERGVYLKG